jgi:glyoxylase-like metal-dependent hydrolase (beta-lactamase superfamily II)/rhodanese-related sulfurtransferase
MPMMFEVFASSGCRSYLVGCESSGVAAVVDPVFDRVDRCLTTAARLGLRIRYAIETHTHADHVSGARALRSATGAALTAHRSSPLRDVDMRLDDGDTLCVGSLRLCVLHTPGHTADSICLHAEDRVFTGDTLLIGGAGRTDLPSGDAGALYDSLFGRLLRLPRETLVFPAHDYRNLGPVTLGAEMAANPKLQASDRAAFVALMDGLDLARPAQMATALRANIAGGRTLAELLAQAAARAPALTVAALAELRLLDPGGLAIVDLRERREFLAGRIPRAVHLPRGELELQVDTVLPDPRTRLVTCCQDGRASLLGAATLRDLGYDRTSFLEGGLRAWRAAGQPWESQPIAAAADAGT